MPKKAKKKNAVAKPAASKKVTKTKAPKKSAKAKSGSRGKRYTPAQKAEVLSYVTEVNATKGRGGAAAASRKFKISQITIGQWVKKDGKPAAAKGATRGRPKGSGKVVAQGTGKGFADKLRRLADVHEAISQTEAQLASLQKEYASLKKGL